MNNDNHKVHEHQILDFLRPQCEVKASYHLRAKINRTLKSHKKYPSLRWMLVGIGSVAAVVIAVILTASPRISATEIIKDALAQIEESFFVKFEARTLPTENFAYLDKNLPFTPITFSVSDDGWMIDKGGRKAMGNDSVRYMWLPEYHTGWLTRQPKPNFIEDFDLLLNPRRLLTRELSQADKDADVRHEGSHIVITTTNDRLTYQYVFDNGSHKLVSYTITEGDATLLRTKEISYTRSKQPIAPIPDDITWIDTSEIKGSLTGLSAKEAAQVALTALKDWQPEIIAQAFTYCAYDFDHFKDQYSGATLLGVGSATQGAIPCKYLVPYRLELIDGTIQSGHLSLERQSDGSWIIDGGI